MVPSGGVGGRTIATTCSQCHQLRSKTPRGNKVLIDGPVHTQERAYKERRMIENPPLTPLFYGVPTVRYCTGNNPRRILTRYLHQGDCAEILHAQL